MGIQSLLYSSTFVPNIAGLCCEFSQHKDIELCTYSKIGALEQIGTTGREPALRVVAEKSKNIQKKHLNTTKIHINNKAPILTTPLPSSITKLAAFNPQSVCY